jgi:hypothetical protein
MSKLAISGIGASNYRSTEYMMKGCFPKTIDVQDLPYRRPQWAEIDILSGAGECQLSTIGERKPTIPFRPHNSFMMMMMGMP